MVKKNTERRNSRNKPATTAQGIVLETFTKRTFNLMCSNNSNIKGIH
jgi:translation initiation factor IF-1